jgi:hypothetical protein
LQKALEARPTLEMARRIRLVLGNQNDPLPVPQRLRDLRLLELLEQINSPDARVLAQTLADGAPDAWLTREAKSMLQRMKARG